VLNIALNGSVMDSNGTLNLMANGFDDDDDFGGSLCTMGLPMLGSGSNSCADWISGTYQNLTVTKSGVGEVYSAPFKIVLNQIGVPPRPNTHVSSPLTLES